jgi:hypothetical protein
MGVTHREREGTGFPRNPTGVGFVVFAAKPQKQQTPPESTGTQVRAFHSLAQAMLTAGDTC